MALTLGQSYDKPQQYPVPTVCLIPGMYTTNRLWQHYIRNKKIALLCSHPFCVLLWWTQVDNSSMSVGLTRTIWIHQLAEKSILNANITEANQTQLIRQCSKFNKLYSYFKNDAFISTISSTHFSTQQFYRRIYNRYRCEVLMKCCSMVPIKAFTLSCL